MSDKPLLVLVHGWGVNASVWNAVLADLAQDFEILAPELFGHAADALYINGNGIEDVTDALAQQIERPAICVGWSLGALLVLRLAISSADKVGSVLLVSATPVFMQRSDWAKGMPQEQLELFMTDFRDHPQRSLKRFHALQARGDAHARRVLTALRAGGVDDVADRSEGLQKGLEHLRDTDLRRQLAGIEQSVHLLHGVNDAVVPGDAGRYLADTLGGDLQLWEQVGHAPFLSQPQRFTDWVRQAAA